MTRKVVNRSEWCALIPDSRHYFEEDDVSVRVKRIIEASLDALEVIGLERAEAMSLMARQCILRLRKAKVEDVKQQLLSLADECDTCVAILEHEEENDE